MTHSLFYAGRHGGASPSFAPTQGIALCRCLSGCFEAFPEVCEQRYQSRYGFLWPIIPEVVNKFSDRSDLEQGFARIRCDDCELEYLRTTLALPRGLSDVVMTIHTFGEHLDFHPHLHALVAARHRGRFTLNRRVYPTDLVPVETEMCRA